MQQLAYIITALKKSRSSFLVLVGATFLIYSPILLNPASLLNRGNDLQEQFWPIFYFIKQQLITNHELPLWNNLWFSGTPLLPDPQSPIFYPLHLLFLILPTDSAFITSFLIHTFMAGVGAYFLGRYGFNFSRATSTFAALLYIASPRLAGFLEAGHPGLVESWAFLPFIALSAVKLASQPKPKWSILLGISLAGTFYTHTIIFLISSIAAITVLLVDLILKAKRQAWKKPILFFLLGGVITFGLTAITLLPQIEWSGHATRFLLLNDRDVYPKWTGIEEFMQASFLPLSFGEEGIHRLDPEKWITLGTAATVLAAYGFLQLEKRLKIIVAISAAATTTLALNNSSPLYGFLLDQGWYVLSRVSTRLWFIPIIMVTFLSAYAVEKLKQKKFNKKFLLPIALLTIGELVALSWIRINKPINQPNFAPKEVYEYLSSDDEKFRVFCLNRCLSQKEAAKYGLELLEGYNTLQQNNYYKHSWQLMGGYWDYYTLSLPPIGIYKFEELKPDARSLGEFNTKYVISPYELVDKNFILEKQFGEYYIYRNSLAQPRAYFWTEDQKPGIAAKIISYSPNTIRVDTSSSATTRLVLAEVWSPGWKAYLNGKEKVVVQEKPDTLRLVNLKPNTQSVDFKYQPDSFKVGKLVSFITLLSLFVYGLLKWKTRVSRKWKNNTSFP